MAGTSTLGASSPTFNADPLVASTPPLGVSVLGSEPSVSRASSGTSSVASGWASGATLGPSGALSSPDSGSFGASAAHAFACVCSSACTPASRCCAGSCFLLERFSLDGGSRLESYARFSVWSWLAAYFRAAASHGWCSYSCSAFYAASTSAHVVRSFLELPSPSVLIVRVDFARAPVALLVIS